MSVLHSGGTLSYAWRSLMMHHRPSVSIVHAIFMAVLCILNFWWGGSWGLTPASPSTCTPWNVCPYSNTIEWMDYWLNHGVLNVSSLLATEPNYLSWVLGRRKLNSRSYPGTATGVSWPAQHSSPNGRMTVMFGYIWELKYLLTTRNNSLLT